VVDPLAVSKEPLRLTVAGYIKGSSAAEVWAAYDELKAAVDASVTPGNDPMLLTVDGRSIYVRKENMTTERLPGLIIKVSIRFIAEKGDWE